MAAVIVWFLCIPYSENLGAGFCFWDQPMTRSECATYLQDGKAANGLDAFCVEMSKDGEKDNGGR